MKAFSLFAVFAMISGAAIAVPGGEKDGKGPGGFMDNLTDEQKACIEQQGCPKIERPQGEKPSGEKGVKPEKKELTAEEKASREAERECRKKAFEACGVEMPQRPEGQGPHGGQHVKPRAE